MKRMFRCCTLLLLTVFVSLAGAGCNPSNKMGTPNNQQSNLRKTSYNDGTPRNITRNIPNDQVSQNYRLADHVAKKINSLKEVKTSSAVVSGNKAYVAVTLKGKKQNTNLEKSMEHKIMKQAKSADPNLKHVYVSTHPDFVQRLGNYTNQVRNGHPIKHLTNDLYRTIQYVFPPAR